MSKRRISLLSLIGSLLLALALLTFGILTGEKANGSPRGAVTETHLSSDSEDTVTIATNKKCDYKIVFSSDTATHDSLMATELTGIMRDRYGVLLRSVPDTAPPSELEILIGNTNRAVSVELVEMITAATELPDDLVYGIIYKDGKLAYAANSADAFNYGKSDFLSLAGEDSFVVTSDLLIIVRTSREEYDALIAADKEAVRQQKINELIAKNNKFKQSDFGGAPKSMGESPYAPPVHYPAANQHPRMYITRDKLDDVIEIMKDETFAPLVERFWSEVEREGCIDGFPVVNFNDPNGEYEKDYYRYDVNIISALQNKAFAYLLTGNELYGYEAIVGTKNMILTLEYSTYLHMDMYHGPSHLMIAIAKIYDWCYDLLTEEDKNHIIAGVSNILAPGMEMKFPPSNLSAVSGHGTGPQLLRDYMMICISFYDEVPDWWEFVGGRFYEQYVPVINEHTKNGWVTQGTACYGPGKYYELMIPAWLIYLSTGQLCYEDAGIRQSPYFVISHLQGNNKWFQTGDGARNPVGGSTDFSYLYTAAALFGDPVLTAYLYEATNNLYKAVLPDWGNDDTAAKLLAYLAYMPKPVESPFEHIDTIQYFAHPAGQMTARDSWDNGAAVAFMKIGTMTMANHDIYDSGTFQIYYKGLLAATSGTYNKYGSNVHRYYLQSTVAHNGLLVFNPSFADAEAVLGLDELGNPDPLNVTNGARYFYSGSQKRRNEAGTIENWLGGNYEMGAITGYEYAYSLISGKADFAYISGDITEAYDSATVSFIERRMLTVFTDDEAVPMLFFTFDTIEATDASFGKTFLLHTTKEPVIDTENMTADIREGDGRLVVQSLFGADNIEKIGGAGYAYWINGYYTADGSYVEGKNCVDQYAPNDNANKFWGRMQLTARGEKTTQMLTAMYVTDAENEETPLFEKFSNDKLYGAKFDDKYIVFLSSRDRTYKEFELVTEGKGLSRYFVSGIEAGTWRVYVDDVPVATVSVSEDGGFADFIAPSGTVKFTPGDDVVGANGGKIQYFTNGGMMGDGVPYSYKNETDTSLTLNITKKNSTFLGWYTTPTFEKDTKINIIPAGTTGTIRVYAKWLTVFANETFSSTVIDHAEKSQSINGINYNAASKAGASFKTMKDEDGVAYLEWIEGAQDPLITVTNTTDNFATMSAEDETVSFEFEISRNGDEPIMPLHLRIQSNVEYGTGKDRVFGEEKVFTVNQNGTVRLGASGPEIANIADGKRVKIRIAVDFANETLTAYDEYGFELQSMKLNVPVKSGAPNGVEWRKLMKQYLAYVYPTGASDHGGSIRIYGIKISESNVLINKEAMETAITYKSNGGLLEDGAPRFYSKIEDTPLPSITKTGAEFDGWYTTETFEEGTRVEKIGKETTGPITLYAKWINTFVDTVFDGDAINGSDSGNGSVDGVDFLTSGKEGASAVTKTDENGKSYVEWVKGKSDTIMRIMNSTNNFSTMADSSASYVLSFGKKAGTPILSSSQIILQSNVASDGTDRVFGSQSLFKITKNAEVYSANGVLLGTISESEIFTLRFNIDFENGAIIYYDEAFEPITTHVFSAPEASGANSTAEWQRLIRQYMLYFRANDNSISPESTLLVYGITVKEGNAFSAENAPAVNSIKYQTGGGTLPAGTPTEYNPELDTPLPTPKKADAIFDGWYTSSTFEDATRVEKIPAGTSGRFTVYAKWRAALVNLDFEDVYVHADESASTTVGSVTFATKNKSGASFISKTDENGKAYVEWVKGSADSLIGIQNSSSNFSTMTETVASYSLKLRKKAGADVVKTTQMTLESDCAADGTANVWGELRLFDVAEDGTVTRHGTEETVAVISEDEVTELNFTVDFAAGLISVYDKNGSVTHEYSFSAPEKSGAASTAEWQRLIKRYMLYMRADDNSASPDSALMIYGITIAPGNIFE